MPLIASSVRRVLDMDADKVRFRGRGISGTAAAGTTTAIDLKLTEERLLEGGQIILSGHVLGDHIAFEVVDVDNVLGYGAGVVLDQYATNWYVDPSTTGQYVIRLEYVAFILANLYLRLTYTSTGGSTVSVCINYFTHKPLA